MYNFAFIYNYSITGCMAVNMCLYLLLANMCVIYFLAGCASAFAHFSRYCRIMYILLLLFAWYNITTASFFYNIARCGFHVIICCLSADVLSVLHGIIITLLLYLCGLQYSCWYLFMVFLCAARLDDVWRQICLCD